MVNQVALEVYYGDRNGDNAVFQQYRFSLSLVTCLLLLLAI